MKPLHEIARECANDPAVMTLLRDTVCVDEKHHLDVTTDFFERLASLILTALTAAQQSGEQDGEWAKRAVDDLWKEFGVAEVFYSKEELEEWKRKAVDKILKHAPHSDGGDGAARYEYVRRLNPREFSKLWERNLKGEGGFDQLVDAARAQEGREWPPIKPSKG